MREPTVVAVSGPVNGTAVLDDNGDGDPANDEVVFTPTPGFSGDAAFDYRVADGYGGEATATVAVTVTKISNVVPDVAGTDGNDVLRGRNGDEIIAGGDGNDRITGGRGNDTLIGGPADDVLAGGRENDTLEGGPGADTFRLDVRDARLRDAGNVDIIVDLDFGEGDQLQIGLYRQLFAVEDGQRLAGNNAFMRYETVDSDPDMRALLNLMVAHDDMAVVVVRDYEGDRLGLDFGVDRSGRTFAAVVGGPAITELLDDPTDNLAFPRAASGTSAELQAFFLDGLTGRRYRV